jgi:outer membrane protein assembly factor BamB
VVQYVGRDLSEYGMMKNLFLLMVGVAPVILSTACEKKEILTGKREAISGVTVENGAGDLGAGTKINVTPPFLTSSYIDVAGSKQHNSFNYKLHNFKKVLWSTSIGGGQINSNIVALDGDIYAVSALGKLVCISQKDGKKKWNILVAKQPDGAIFTGGLTINNGIIYVATNIGTVIAIDSKTHKELWSKAVKFPFRGVPLCAYEKIIVASVENRTLCFDASNGNVIWSKANDREQTIMAEMGTPAVFQYNIICGDSSGSLQSIDLNGTYNWEDVLFSSDTSQSGSTISHIVASPVVVGNAVLVATSESKMAMFDCFSGVRLWEQSIGTVNQPVINSGWVFVVSSDGKVICLSEEDGAIRWTSDIDSLCSKKGSKDQRWFGPMIINGDLWIFGSNGNVLNIDISTGNLKKNNVGVLKNKRLSKMPIIVDGDMFVATSNGDICKIG